MRNLDYFLNDPWYHNNLLNNFFNFDNFRHFNQLVNYFLDSDLDFFYPFNDPWNLNNFLNYTVHNLNLFDVLNVWFFYFHNFRLLNNFLFNAFDWHNMRNMDSFDDNLWHFDGNSDDSVLEYRYLNLFLHNLDLFNNFLNNYVLYFLDFPWNNLLDDLLHKNLNGSNLRNVFFDNDWNLDSLRDVHDFIDYGLDWHQLLDIYGNFN